jgi:hypothetical protein
MFEHFFDANLPFAGLVNCHWSMPLHGLAPVVRFGKRAVLVSYPKGVLSTAEVVSCRCAVATGLHGSVVSSPASLAFVGFIAFVV